MPSNTATDTSSFGDVRFESFNSHGHGRRTRTSTRAFESFNASTFDSLDDLDETFDDNDKPLNMVMVGGLVDFYQLLDVSALSA